MKMTEVFKKKLRNKQTKNGQLPEQDTNIIDTKDQILVNGTSWDQKVSVRQKKQPIGQNGNLQNGKKNFFFKPTSQRGLITKIYKELRKQDINKPNNWI